MSKFEKWLRFALFAISLIFAGFLSSLGDKLLSDADRMYQAPQMASFQDEAKLKPIKDSIELSQQKLKELEDKKHAEQKGYRDASAAYDSAKETYRNWLAARGFTESKSQNSEVISRAKKLEQLKETEDRLLARVNAAQANSDQKTSELAKLNEQLQVVEAEATTRYESATRVYSIRLFLVRLLFVLPVLLFGAWLFVRKRQGKLAPLVWGYILFALFLFFFGLVPYLPSFGGYVRAAVGVILTGFLGYYLTEQISRYRQRLAERAKTSAQERSNTVTQALAIKSYTGHTCPSCEKDFWVGQPDGGKRPKFCSHCGLELFVECKSCKVETFKHFGFCWSCGCKQT